MQADEVIGQYRDLLIEARSLLVRAQLHVNEHSNLGCDVVKYLNDLRPLLSPKDKQ